VAAEILFCPATGWKGCAGDGVSFKGVGRPPPQFAARAFPDGLVTQGLLRFVGEPVGWLSRKPRTSRPGNPLIDRPSNTRPAGCSGRGNSTHCERPPVPRCNGNEIPTRTICNSTTNRRRLETNRSRGCAEAQHVGFASSFTRTDFRQSDSRKSCISLYSASIDRVRKLCIPTSGRRRQSRIFRLANDHRLLRRKFRIGISYRGPTVGGWLRACAMRCNPRVFLAVMLLPLPSGRRKTRVKWPPETTVPRDPLSPAIIQRPAPDRFWPRSLVSPNAEGRFPPRAGASMLVIRRVVCFPTKTPGHSSIQIQSPAPDKLPAIMPLRKSAPLCNGLHLLSFPQHDADHRPIAAAGVPMLLIRSWERLVEQAAEVTGIDSVCKLCFAVGGAGSGGVGCRNLLSQDAFFPCFLKFFFRSRPRPAHPNDSADRCALPRHRDNTNPVAGRRTGRASRRAARQPRTEAGTLSAVFWFGRWFSFSFLCFLSLSVSGCMGKEAQVEIRVRPPDGRPCRIVFDGRGRQGARA